MEKITPKFLESIGIFELREIGREIGVYSPTTLKREALVNKILDIYEGRTKPIARTNRGRPVKVLGNTKDIVSSVRTQAELNYEFDKIDRSLLILREPISSFEALKSEEDLQCAGILDITIEGYGIIKVKNFSRSDIDAYIPLSLVENYQLKSGDLVHGIVKTAQNLNTMHTVLAVNDINIADFKERKNFDDLTPVYPDKKIISFDAKDSPVIKSINLIAPIGNGQRAVVFSPKYTKTNLLIELAENIYRTNTNIEIMALLISEFPEEVTEIKKSVKGEVVFSTFEEPNANHIVLAELVVNRGKRFSESGKDVVILVNNANALLNAYSIKGEAQNISIKKFFGAARNLEEGGSLTLVLFANEDEDPAY
ncbi:MAG: hypothetical protein FWG51_03120, partial [Firmicutes bacterium]|nr:hypothetical protein [Bacillota bacterium]